jgi:hypothetical protein
MQLRLGQAVYISTEVFRESAVRQRNCRVALLEGGINCQAGQAVALSSDLE